MNTPPYRYSLFLPARQTGVVLLLCLLLLAALTLVGLSASAETVMQGMLAHNLQESQRARQSALAAQQWAERWMLALAGEEPLSCLPPCEGLGIHAAGSLPTHPEAEDLSWWTANGHEAGVDPLTGQRLAILSTDSITPPLWLVERLHAATAVDTGAANDQVWYRILARGVERTGTGIAVVESIVSRPWRPAGAPQPEGVTLQGRCPGFDPGAPCQRLAWRSLR